MIYKYRNLKGVKIHGIEPHGIGVFDHPIEGGCIELIEETPKRIKKIKTVKEDEE